MTPFHIQRHQTGRLIKILINSTYHRKSRLRKKLTPYLLILGLVGIIVLLAFPILNEPGTVESARFHNMMIFCTDFSF